MQAACKPGSVQSPKAPVRSFIWTPGRPRVLAVHHGGPGADTRGRLRGAPPNSTLHQAGLAMPPPLPEARWALAPPFHPCRPAGRRFVFCGAVPRARGSRPSPGRALPGAVSAWCPDFPQPPEGRRDRPTACTRGGIEPRARRVQRDVAARGREGEQEGGGLGAGGAATGGARSRRKIEAQGRDARSRRRWRGPARVQPIARSATGPSGKRAARSAARARSRGAGAPPGGVAGAPGSSRRRAASIAASSAAINSMPGWPR